MSMEIHKGDEDQKVIQQIEKKLQETEDITEGGNSEMRKVLMSDKEVFRDAPGRIRGYEHRLEVTDTTQYCQKGWPVPLKYQDAVEREINRMERYGIIERSTSPYGHCNQERSER